MTTTYWTDSNSAGHATFYTPSGSNWTENAAADFGQQWSISGDPDTLTVGQPVDLLQNGVYLETDTYLGYIVAGGVEHPALTDGNTYFVLGIASAANQMLVSGVICFLAGSRIATPRGPVPVERLRPGDRVVTASGATRRLRWVGRQRADPAGHPSPADILPVRIAPHAFAPGAPGTELLVSPEHAIAVEGVLVAARQLCNGGSIVQAAWSGVLDYVHIELDSHDLVLAEGLACETYLDLANRAAFTETHGRPGDAAPGDTTQQTRAASCLPFLTDPARIEAIWRRLAARAAELGLACPAVALSDDPMPRLRIDGAEYQPVSARGGSYRFLTPASAGRAQLVSRAAAPSATRPWLRDMRQLGVGLLGLAMQHDGRMHRMAPGDAAFAGLRGWWDAEPGLRWTAGAGELPCDLSQPGLLQIDLLPALYPA